MQSSTHLPEAAGLTSSDQAGSDSNEQLGQRSRDGNSSKFNEPMIKNTSRKRKRSKATSSRKFECSDCGKAYSRAEHLNRHQLNHAPKQIFACEWANCTRSFVRQDLLARHTERHLARNGELQRRDLYKHRRLPSQPNIEGSNYTAGPREGANPEHVSLGLNRTQEGIRGPSEHQQKVIGSNKPPILPTSATFETASFRSQEARNMSTVPTTLSQFQSLMPQSHQKTGAWPSSIPSPAWSTGTDGSYQKMNKSRNAPGAEFQPNITSGSGFKGGMNEYNTSPYDIESQGRQKSSIFGPSSSNAAYQFPDELTAWLFESSNQSGQSFLPDGNSFGMFSEHYFLDGVDSVQEAYEPLPPPNPMSVSNLIDLNLPESKLSDLKRRELLHLITSKFSDVDQIPECRPTKSFLEGNHDYKDHVLSLSMMQTYIGSYWYHFHPQVPILHKPTFSADQTPDLLLLAMMALGASCLERVHGHATTQACAELASFVAWHLRWALFRHEASRPPAKLWMFQALLLLEFYEKMYSTRELHERAHIHHTTTVTLLRRGSFLVGTAAGEPDNTNSNSGMSLIKASDPWWDKWVMREATWRAVFAAFVMDILHAVSFAHSAEMATHEMRLPLPCDEALWSATSGNEVSRIEASLLANGVKPPNFLDALKRTLNRQRVQTNPFGRTIIMAGLLSVSWHLNQRDLQVTALGVGGQKPVGKVKWRISMGKAFEFWKEDFDLSLAQAPAGPSTSSHSYRYTQGIDDENVFESRIVMLHLAHMSMHVDLVDCQIFAGAQVLTGRHVTSHDYASAKRRIREVWAPSDRAREATFHALKFISQVLMPEEQTDSGRASTGFHHTTTQEYSAREDFLINRPWILFIAGLIIWCYGYALDGPVSLSSAVPPPQTKEDKIADMKVFLQRVGGIDSPDELTQVRRRSSCVGLLMTLKDLFVETRWELLHEAMSLLDMCIAKLLATGSPD